LFEPGEDQVEEQQAGQEDIDLGLGRHGRLHESRLDAHERASAARNAQDRRELAPEVRERDCYGRRMLIDPTAVEVLW
jgi:hypothetical protein